MARPKMNPMDRRSEQITVQVTPHEYDRLRDYADHAGENLSAFMRAAALGSSVKVVQIAGLDFEDKQQLVGIANNLNQTVKALNNRRLPVPPILESCLQKVDQILETMLNHDHSNRSRPEL